MCPQKKNFFIFCSRITNGFHESIGSGFKFGLNAEVLTSPDFSLEMVNASIFAVVIPYEPEEDPNDFATTVKPPTNFLILVSSLLAAVLFYG